MKRKTCHILLISSILAFAGCSRESSKAAKINRLLDISGINNDATLKQMSDQMTATLAQTAKGETPQQRARVQEMQSKVLDLVRTHLRSPESQRFLVQTYDTTYSEPEIDGMLAFYESPAGRAMLKKSPQITLKLAAWTQTQMLPEIERIAKQSITPAAGHGAGRDRVGQPGDPVVQRAADAVNHFHVGISQARYQDVCTIVEPNAFLGVTSLPCMEFLAYVHEHLGAVVDGKPAQLPVVEDGPSGTARLELRYDTHYKLGKAREVFDWRINGPKATLMSYEIEAAALSR